MPSYPVSFYVYLLADPKTGVPFYCGKGQRDRAWQHARAVGRGDLSGNVRKVAKIQEILSRGDQVDIQIVAEYDLEDDALEHEFEIVDSMPELTNAVPGGGGGPGGRRLTAKDIAEREQARYNRIIQRRREIFISTRERHEFDRRDRFLSNPAYKGHQAEVEAWLERTKPEVVSLDRVSVKKRKNGRGFVAQLKARRHPPKAIAAQREREQQGRLDDAAEAERQRRISRMNVSDGACVSPQRVPTVA